MGVHTGKVLDFATCNKRCQKCETADRLGLEVRKHDCRKNFVGSSKSMEPSVATTLFKRTEPGICYKQLIGDDDSSTIAKIHKEVDKDVLKISDIQHVKRNLDGQLIKIKPQHKELTERVSKYVKKCFTYAIAQNEGNATGLACSLRAIPGHMFGTHDNCGTWCGFKKDPVNYKRKFSKSGMDLKSEDLHKDLSKILDRYFMSLLLIINNKIIFVFTTRVY